MPSPTTRLHGAPPTQPHAIRAFPASTVNAVHPASACHRAGHLYCSIDAAASGPRRHRPAEGGGAARAMGYLHGAPPALDEAGGFIPDEHRSGRALPPPRSSPGGPREQRQRADRKNRCSSPRTRTRSASRREIHQRQEPASMPCLLCSRSPPSRPGRLRNPMDTGYEVATRRSCSSTTPCRQAIARCAIARSPPPRPGRPASENIEEVAANDPADTTRTTTTPKRQHQLGEQYLDLSETAPAAAPMHIRSPPTPSHRSFVRVPPAIAAGQPSAPAPSSTSSACRRTARRPIVRRVAVGHWPRSAIRFRPRSEEEETVARQRSAPSPRSGSVKVIGRRR